MQESRQRIVIILIIIPINQQWQLTIPIWRPSKFWMRKNNPNKLLTAAQIQEQSAVLKDEGQQKAATLNSSLPTSSSSSSSDAGDSGVGGKKETLQSELRNVGISLNLMLGILMPKRKHPLPPAGGTDLETEKQLFIEHYITRGLGKLLLKQAP